MAWPPDYPSEGGLATTDAGDGLLPHPPFYFDTRRVRIDWRLLHSLDLGQIQIRTDLDALSRVLDLIAYGDLEAEDVRNLSETNFLKIFRLAQMIVEYLLYVQSSLNRESKYYQQMHHKEKSHIAALRLRCREQKEQLSSTKRELRQCKSHLKTMQVLAEQGNRENQAPNPQPPPSPPPPPPPPQVIYVDSPDTLALVQQLQEDLDRMTDQRRVMQSTIEMLTNKLEEIEDVGLPVAVDDGNYTGNLQYSPGSMPTGGASDYAPSHASPKRPEGGGISAEELNKQVDAARRQEREQYADKIEILNRKVTELETEKARLEEAAKEAAERPPLTKQPSFTGVAEVERLRRRLEQTEEKKDIAEEAQNNLKIEVRELQDKLEHTEEKLREALAARMSSAGLGDMEDDSSPPRWDRERSELKAALVEAQQKLDEAERKLKVASEGGTEARQYQQQVERLRLVNSDLVSEAQSLRDENTKLTHLLESRTPTRMSSDGQISELESSVAELQRERGQLLMDVEVARQTADKLRAELDDRIAEVKRLEALLDKAGIEYEADLKQAASEGRRVKHQAEHFMKTAGDSAGKPPSGPRSGSVTPPPRSAVAATAEQPREEPPVAEDEMEDVEDFSDPNDSPMASLAGPVPTRMLAGSASSFSSTRDLLRSASEAAGGGSGLLRSASVSRLSTGALAPQRRAVSDVKRTSMGWLPDAGSSPPVAPKQSQPPPDPEESTDIEEFNPQDLAPKPSQPFGGVSSSKATSERAGSSVVEEEVESFRFSDEEDESSAKPPEETEQSAASDVRQVDLPPIAPKSASAVKPPPSGSSAPSSPGAASMTSPAKSASPSGSSPSTYLQEATQPRDAHSEDLLRVIYGPYDIVDDMATDDPGITAAEEREMADESVEEKYSATPDLKRLWKERKTRFKDIFCYDTLIEGKQGRLSTALLTMATLNDAKNKHGKTIRQELDREMRTYGVNPLQTHLRDDEFADVMEKLDMRRSEIDRAAADNPQLLEHIEFMRDTIRHHLQSEAGAYVTSGQAREQADPPANLLKNDSDGDDESLEERSDDSNARSLRAPGTVSGAGSSAHPSGSAAVDDNEGDDDMYDQSNDSTESLRKSAPHDDIEDEPPAHSLEFTRTSTESRSAPSKEEGALSDVQVLSSFDASSDEDDNRPSPKMPESSKPTGPVWSRTHDDPFDTSTESTGGGAWGAQRQNLGGRPQTSSTAYVEPYDDDFDDTLETLLI